MITIHDIRFLEPLPTENDKKAVTHLVQDLDVSWWLKDRYLDAFATAYALGRLSVNKPILPKKPAGWRRFFTRK